MNVFCRGGIELYLGDRQLIMPTFAGRVHAVVIAQSSRHTVPLIRRWLQSLALPLGTVILDPWMGKGDVAVAAAQLGLGFIGIDAVPTHCLLAAVRVTRALRLATSPEGIGGRN